MLKRLFCAVTACISLVAASQAQDKQEFLQILKDAPMKYVQEYAENMVKHVNANSPIQVDEITSVTSASFDREDNRLLYQVRLSKDIRSDYFYQTQKAKLCAGQINVAMMERTVHYAYAVKTPRQKYTVEYNYFNC